MTILHTLHWVQFAGTEKVCVDLCNEFSKQHEVYLLTDKKIEPFIDKNVKLIEIDFQKNRYNPFFIYEVAKIIKRVNPDIIHIHNTKELEIICHARVFLKNKIPIVGTRHNPVIKKKFTLVDLGVAVSEETRLYTNAKKNITIPNGIPYKEPKKLENLQNNGCLNLVAVGRLSPVKGFHNLIKALSLVKFNFNLNIVGEGEQKNELEELINSLKLENRVKLVGFVNNVQDYIYSSDAQIISSTQEGLSLALIESIFYAKVLIASDIANHKEIIGKDLVYENSIESLSDKLNSLYENYEYFAQKFAEIKKTRDRYSIENMSKKYLDAYKSLLD